MMPWAKGGATKANVASLLATFVVALWSLRKDTKSPCKKNQGPGLARVGQIKFKLFFPGFWPNLGPGRRPLDSIRRDAEFAGVFASVAFLTVSFVPKSRFGNPAEKKVKKYVQARPGPDFLDLIDCAMV